MPRVSAQHEQEVRDRIVRAAIAVFAEHGFHRATMQDIVRAVGPVGRRDLHVLQEQVRADPRRLRPDHRPGAGRARASGSRRSPATASGSRPPSASSSTSSRSSSRAAAVRLADPQAWAEADTDPAIREMLRRRRREIVGVDRAAPPGGRRPRRAAGLARRRRRSRTALAALLDGMHDRGDRGRRRLSASGRRAAGPGDARAALRRRRDAAPPGAARGRAAAARTSSRQARAGAS